MVLISKLCHDNTYSANCKRAGGGTLPEEFCATLSNLNSILDESGLGDLES